MACLYSSQLIRGRLIGRCEDGCGIGWLSARVRALGQLPVRTAELIFISMMLTVCSSRAIRAFRLRIRRDLASVALSLLGMVNNQKGAVILENELRQVGNALRPLV